MANKRLYGNLFSLAILVIILFLMWVFFQDNITSFPDLTKIPLYYYAIIIISLLLTIVFNGLKIKKLTEFYKIKLGFSEWFGLSSVNTMATYLAPFRMGIGARALYLKRVHKLPYTSFIVTLGATFLSTSMIISFIGALSLLSIGDFSNNGIVTLFILFLAVLAGSLVICIFSPKFRLTRFRLVNHAVNALNQWRVLKKEGSILPVLLLLDFLILLMFAVRFYFIFLGLSFDISFSTVFLISSLIFASDMVNITPANLGIREGLIAVITKTLNNNFSIGLYATAIDRIITIIIVFLTGLFYSYVLSKKGYHGK